MKSSSFESIFSGWIFIEWVPFTRIWLLDNDWEGENQDKIIHNQGVKAINVFKCGDFLLLSRWLTPK